MNANDLEAALNTPLKKLDESFQRVTKKLDYYNLGIGGQSYSRSIQLHACPRKFEIATKFKLKPKLENVNFAYGHAVGGAIQKTIAGGTLDEVILEVITEYDMDITRSETDARAIKSGKTFWNAVCIAQRFYEFYHSGLISYLNGWEVANFKHPETGEDVSGIELTFVIDCGKFELNGQTYSRTYEGHIDLVLWHPTKRRYMVLELKTSGGNRVDDAAYCNSAQALGYGVVLDAIAGNFKLSASFDVLYLVAKSKSDEFIPLIFTKTYKDKASFLMNMLLDFEEVEKYEELGHYPMRGESCNDFFSACEYIDVCKHDNEELERRQLDDTADSVVYSKMETPTFMFTIEQMFDIQDQLLKVSEDTAAKHGEVDMLLDVTNVIN